MTANDFIDAADFPAWPIYSPSAEDILAMAARSNGMTVEQMMVRSRAQRIAHARHVAMYLVRKHTELSFPAIGCVFGKDHSTIIHACNLIQSRMAAQRGFALTMERLSAEIGLWQGRAAAAVVG